MSCPIHVSFCFVILVSASLSEHFELSSSLFVSGNVGEDVILPCQVSPAMQPQNLKVQWTKTVNGNTEIIYQYTAVTDQEVFGQDYEERTLLSKEGLTSGNVSLKLKTIQMADEGNYKCIVTSTHWGAQAQTVLHVTTGHSGSDDSPWFSAFCVMTSLFLILTLGITIYCCKYKKKRGNVPPRKESKEEEELIQSAPLQEPSCDPDASKETRDVRRFWEQKDRDHADQKASTLSQEPLSPIKVHTTEANQERSKIISPPVDVKSDNQELKSKHNTDLENWLANQQQKATLQDNFQNDRTESSHRSKTENTKEKRNKEDVQGYQKEEKDERERLVQGQGNPEPIERKKDHQQSSDNIQHKGDIHACETEVHNHVNNNSVPTENGAPAELESKNDNQVESK